MLKVDDWIKRLKYLVMNRRTYYSNRYPDNCGMIHSGAILSFDCIGMVKSVINNPDIVYKVEPTGYYVKPNQVIPDTTEKGILNLCTDVAYDFKNITQGEYLYMSGHAGVYVGAFEINNHECNVVECTSAWENGVIGSWIDLSTGKRYNHRNGEQKYQWEAHGKLSKYIDYSQPNVKLVVDGDWGINTTNALQKFLGVKVDGVIAEQPKIFKKYCTACSEQSWRFVNYVFGSSNTIKALQTWCGMQYNQRDGRFGPTTIRALQKKLGNLKLDGYCGEYTVKALQKFLNSSM